MVAAPRLQKKRNTFIPEIVGERFPALLKVAAVYGPNASGKSSFTAALDVASELTRNLPTTKELKLPVTSFRFDKDLIDKPSCFEYNFIANGIRYQFNLSLTSERIFKEELIAYLRGKETLLYSRSYDGKSEYYEFGDKLEGGSLLHQTWSKLTNPKTLFIVQAVANSSEDLNQLSNPLTWLQRGLKVIGSDVLYSWAQGARTLGVKDDSFAKEISEFLQEVDVPVAKMKFNRVSKNIVPNDSEDDIEEFHKEVRNADKNIKTTITHKTALGEADFDFSEESGGTQNLIGFWLPWSMLGLEFSQLRVLVIDELDSSLHPKIVADLVDRHLSKENPSQLIFTTHDTHLMNAKLLRRDQFWITERDKNGATRLNSIYDFDGRESEDVEKRYYEGRYRGLPILHGN